MIYLGVDVGSTGCKCVAFRMGGEELASAYEEYPRASGEANLNPWLLSDSVFSVIRRCADSVPDRTDIASVTVSSFGESFAALSEDGRELGDIVMYYADNKSSRFSELVSAFGAERIMEITRTMPDTMYSLPKMLLTMEAAGKRVSKFLLIADYIVYKLTGETVTDYALACRSLLFDPVHLRWSPELLAAAGITEDQLPTPLPTGSIVAPVRPGVAEDLGLAPGTKVVIGSHDQVACALGTGVLTPGEGVDGTGTVECITPLFSAVPEKLDFIRRNFVSIPYLGLGYVTYAFNLSGGSLLKWFRDSIASSLGAEAIRRGCSVYRLLDEMCPGEPSELTVLPHFQGAGGTPDVERSARGALWGLSFGTGTPEIYRGLLEGLTFEMAYNLEVLSGFGIRPERLFAAGGGARSAPWLQIKADILSAEIIPVKTGEAGALGGAILAAAALEGEHDIAAVARQFVRYGVSYTPNTALERVYKEKYEIYKELRGLSLRMAARA